MFHGLYLAYRRLSYCWLWSAGTWPKVHHIEKLCYILLAVSPGFEIEY